MPRARKDGTDLIERYWKEPLKRIWSDEEKFNRWLRVELVVIDFLRRKNIVSERDWRSIHRRAGFSVRRIAQLESKLQHDVIAFVTNVEERVGPAGRWIHFGLTSSDVVDTALSMALQESLDAILGQGDLLLRAIKPLTRRYAKKLIMGRTHGVFAEPMSLGFKFHVFYSELARRLDHLRDTRELARVGKLSGAVGMNIYYSPADESRILRQLGLKAAGDATQILPRDIFAQISSALALLATGLEHLAQEIRHLHRSEVQEIQEGFARGQRGSSAMPHKKNPMLCERVCGLARIVRSLSLAQMETIPLWHERDLTNSSTERITLPDQTSLAYYMLLLMTRVVEGLTVRSDNIRANLSKANGVYWSGYLLNRLIRKGWSRNRAYDEVQRVALQCADQKFDFLETIRRDPKLKEYFTDQELKSFSPEIFWKNALKKL